MFCTTVLVIRNTIRVVQFRVGTVRTYLYVVPGAAAASRQVISGRAHAGKHLPLSLYVVLVQVRPAAGTLVSIT
jgi:hypothetical protein